jgi:hypothetical protein
MAIKADIHHKNFISLSNVKQKRSTKYGKLFCLTILTARSLKTSGMTRARVAFADLPICNESRSVHPGVALVINIEFQSPYT